MGEKRNSEYERIMKVKEAVNKLADALAAAISARDAERVASMFIDDSFTTYVSDGTVIPYDELIETLDRFYGKLCSLEFHWDKTEVDVLGEDKAMLIAWATYVSTPLRCEPMTSRAVYTLLCVKLGDRWGILVAHKSSIE